MSIASSLFASHARGNTITFKCSLDCKLGAYSLAEGEPLRVVDDRDGLFSVYVEWGEGAIGRFSAKDINKLAGYEAVKEQPMCSCLDPVHPGDDPFCKVHGHWIGGVQ
jgi:hypothetical protein